MLGVVVLGCFSSSLDGPYFFLLLGIQLRGQGSQISPVDAISSASASSIHLFCPGLLHSTERSDKVFHNKYK